MRSSSPLPLPPLLSFPSSPCPCDYLFFFSPPRFNERSQQSTCRPSSRHPHPTALPPSLPPLIVRRGRRAATRDPISPARARNLPPSLPLPLPRQRWSPRQVFARSWVPADERRGCLPLRELRKQRSSTEFPRRDAARRAGMTHYFRAPTVKQELNVVPRSPAFTATLIQGTRRGDLISVDFCRP